jgi:hypothetical protein
MATADLGTGTPPAAPSELDRRPELAEAADTVGNCRCWGRCVPASRDGAKPMEDRKSLVLERRVRWAWARARSD